MNTENVLMEVLNDSGKVSYNTKEIETNAKLIEETIFNSVKSIKFKGYEIEPLYIKYFFTARSGAALKKALKLSEDVKLKLSARSLRSYITPETDAVCFEVENKQPSLVALREVFGAPIENYNPNGLYLTIGKAGNKAINCNLLNAPHLLVAGTTGSGKTVFLDQALLSLVARYSPEKLNVVLIDVKGVDYREFKNFSHLTSGKVISSESEIETTLENLVLEMERRYNLLDKAKVINLQKYNESEKALPYIAVVIDEFVELISYLSKGFTAKLQRLLQMGRGVGIHLILSSQSVFGLEKHPQIKALIPTRIICRLPSLKDSLSIIGNGDAYKLLGKGDALYVTLNQEVKRITIPFVSQKEIIEYQKAL